VEAQVSSSDKCPEILELDKPAAVGRHVVAFFRLRRRQWADLAVETFSEWSNDNVPRLGAALAYYSLFSLAPLLIVVIAVAGLAFGREAAEGQIVWQIRDLVGKEGAEAIQKMIQSAWAPAKGIFATAIGIITLIFGASLVVSELRNSLNLIWKAPQPKDAAGIFRDLLRLLRHRFLSFAMVLGVGFLLLISLVINAVLAGVGKHLQSLIAMPEVTLQITTLAIWLVVTTGLFALIYKVLPDVRIAWSDVAIGALVTSTLFTIGKALIALYLGKSSVASTYGAAGSLVVVLLWIYYSAQIFFLGAEFTKVYANKYGSRLRSRLSVKPTDLSIPPSEPMVKAS
jgi:membrane protein